MIEKQRKIPKVRRISQIIPNRIKWTRVVSWSTAATTHLPRKLDAACATALKAGQILMNAKEVRLAQSYLFRSWRYVY